MKKKGGGEKKNEEKRKDEKKEKVKVCPLEGMGCGKHNLEKKVLKSC